MTTSRRTLVELFQSRAKADDSDVALHIPSGNNSFRTITWHELAREVRHLAAGLRRAGVQTGDRVALVAENRYEWLLCDFSVHAARGIHVAIHASLSPQQIAFQIRDCDARLIVVSTREQAEKLASVAELLPRGVAIYSMEPCDVPIAGQPPRPFAALSENIGDANALQQQAEAVAATTPDDMATILYTSGTTGEAKGVMLTHGNLTHNALAACAEFDFTNDDLRLCWLPLSHIFARTCDLYTWLVRGSQLALAESREKIIANCAAIKPTLLSGVPYFFDKVQRGLIATGKVGPVSPGGPSHLQQLLGGRIRLCTSGGAALPTATEEFFWREGVPVVQGYGLTETSPVITTCSLKRHKVGTVGPAIADVEIRIAADGEIVTRGPHVMRGYWNRPDDTAAAIIDGWFHTGDLGRLDDDGFLTITGRKKELIVTAAGKNIAPVYLEGLLTQQPLIAQAMIVCEGRKCLAALIVPNPDTLRAEIITRQIPVTSAAEALVHPAVYALYRQSIDQALSVAAAYEQVSQFRLLPRGFTIEHDELTPTLKLRRRVVAQHFAAEIEQLYAESDV